MRKELCLVAAGGSQVLWGPLPEATYWLSGLWGTVLVPHAE
jgi:hypothetical protein